MHRYSQNSHNNALAVVVLAVPLSLNAGQHSHKHPRYKVVDLGTLGGPLSYGSANGEGGRLLNDAGDVCRMLTLRIPIRLLRIFIDADCLLLTHIAGDASHARPLHSRKWLQQFGRGDQRPRSAGASQTGIIDPSLIPAKPGCSLDRPPNGQPRHCSRRQRESIDFVNAGQAIGISITEFLDPFSMFGIGVT